MKEELTETQRICSHILSNGGQGVMAESHDTLRVG